MAGNVRYLAFTVARLTSESVCERAVLPPDEVLLKRLIDERPGLPPDLIAGYFDHFSREALEAARDSLNLLNREHWAAAAKRALPALPLRHAAEPSGLKGLTDYHLTILAVEVEGALQRKAASGNRHSA